MMRETVTYDGQHIKHRIKNKEGNCAYVLDNDKVLPIIPDSGRFVHNLHMEKGFPADISRQIIQEKGCAVDEEQLQMCINDELIKQIKAEAKKNEQKKQRGT